MDTHNARGSVDARRERRLVRRSTCFCSSHSRTLRLLGIVGISIVVQLGIHHVPVTQQLFQIGALSPADCALTLALGALPLAALELAKLIKRASLPVASPRR